MKKISMISTFVLAVILFACLVPTLAGAETGSWNGWITDDHCDPKKKDVTSATHAPCVRECLVAGRQLVLYTDDKKIFRLDRQDLAKQHIGHAVTVTGKLEGVMIAVDAITKKASK